MYMVFVNIRPDMHYMRNMGCIIFTLTTILSAVTAVILLTFAYFSGQYPKPSGICSIYFPYETAGYVITVLFASQLILQNGCIMFCCFIFSLIVRIISESDHVLNTKESRRIGVML